MPAVQTGGRGTIALSSVTGTETHTVKVGSLSVHFHVYAPRHQGHEHYCHAWAGSVGAHGWGPTADDAVNVALNEMRQKLGESVECPAVVRHTPWKFGDAPGSARSRTTLTDPRSGRTRTVDCGFYSRGAVSWQADVQTALAGKARGVARLTAAQLDAFHRCADEYEQFVMDAANVCET